MRFLIVTAANENFARLLRDLVGSLFQWGPPAQAELGILDLGLSPDSLTWLSGFSDRIVVPDWDLPVRPALAREQPWLRAMTARPFLPRYFPGYDTYLWLDSDTWVQRWFAIEWLVQAAQSGKLAIIPEVDRCYRHDPMFVQWRIDRLRSYFGPLPAGTLLSEPYFNSGVFALKGNAPHWKLWAEWFQKGLQACEGGVASDQTALNYMLWKEDLPVYPLPSRCNWTCHLALPEYRTSTGLFHEPCLPGDPIGIMHLTSVLKNKLMQTTDSRGQPITVGLGYSSARPVDSLEPGS